MAVEACIASISVEAGCSCWAKAACPGACIERECVFVVPTHHTMAPSSSTQLVCSSQHVGSRTLHTCKALLSVLSKSATCITASACCWHLLVHHVVCCWLSHCWPSCALSFALLCVLMYVPYCVLCYLSCCVPCCREWSLHPV